MLMGKHLLLRQIKRTSCDYLSSLSKPQGGEFAFCGNVPTNATSGQFLAFTMKNWEENEMDKDQSGSTTNGE